MSEYKPTPRTELTRKQQRSRTDQATIHEILDSARVGSVSLINRDGNPYILPIAYARDGERVLFHGSTGAFGLRALAEGNQCCFNVFRLNALILARSAFESSMRYESVTVFGKCEVLHGADKANALNAVTEHLFPGRNSSLRPMTEKEIAATLVLALPLVEVSAKVSDGWPGDNEADSAWPVWAGVVPVEYSFGEPLAAPNLNSDFAKPPAYLKNWKA